MALAANWPAQALVSLCQRIWLDTEVMALNVGVICGMVAAAGMGALVVQAALITGATLEGWI